MKDDFYRRFEQSFRGHRAEIKERLQVYEGFVLPLRNIYPEALAIDLGCGRGEWLETLRDWGFPVLGVDLDQAMLADCLALGLNVRAQDAIAALNDLADDSVCLVTAIHVVEHIPFDDLRTLVSEAHRVLKPGGLLILETPNPENIVVGSSNFYIDPTHNNPLPPGLLSYIPRSYGFSTTMALRLQESKALRQNPSPKLQDIFYGVSPDYAVIAQKSASPEILAQFKSAFAIDTGLTLETLCDRYDQAIEQNLLTLRQEMHARHQETLTLLNDTYNSTSWKITRPLRALALALDQIKVLFTRK
jgi:O-antigen chain-terminating methyltransferase